MFQMILQNSFNSVRRYFALLVQARISTKRIPYSQRLIIVAATVKQIMSSRRVPKLQELLEAEESTGATGRGF